MIFLLVNFLTTIHDSIFKDLLIFQKESYTHQKHNVLENEAEFETYLNCVYRVAILDFVSGKDCNAALERNPEIQILETNCTVDWYFPAPEDGN